MTLQEAVSNIEPLDQKAMVIAQKRWDSIAKPLHSLGKLETLLTQVAGITGNADIDLSKRGLVAMCADNGVVEEGVTQTGQPASCKKLPDLSALQLRVCEAHVLHLPQTASVQRMHCPSGQACH